MSSGQTFDIGVPALLGVWLLVGAACAAWLESRLRQDGPIGWGRYLGLVVVALLGPLAGLAVAGYLSTRPRTRIRP